mmetsp:Transcript_26659/g.58251  ORF Transcript_26659/g.58251 Transcript_26659/m.58251 type:complete len:115 (+) Transcript_26659:409-753(+)
MMVSFTFKWQVFAVSGGLKTLYGVCLWESTSSLALMLHVTWVGSLNTLSVQDSKYNVFPILATITVALFTTGWKTGAHPKTRSRKSTAKRLGVVGKYSLLGRYVLLAKDLQLFL